MIKVGITGQKGFIGTHLFNNLSLYKNKYKIINFDNYYFDSYNYLNNFVSNCDVIVHLAGLNRHINPEVIYNTNITLIKKIIEACEKTASKPHIIFASSIQEDSVSQYGKSKREGRLLLYNWAVKNNAKFTGLIIPNVFGPFCKPYYNSVVATFCHQLTHNEVPKVEIDSEINLIYIDELIKIIMDQVDGIMETGERIEVQSTYNIKVSEILEILKVFRNDYFNNGIIPSLIENFHRNLFNTFVCYIDFSKFFPFKLKSNRDNRGCFTELIRTISGGQISFSTTKQGVSRGGHFHTRKFERFIIVKGKALIELQQIGSEKLMSFIVQDNKPSFVDIPIWHIHKLTNIGSQILYTVLWTNEFYNTDDPDTYMEQMA